MDRFWFFLFIFSNWMWLTFFLSYRRRIREIAKDIKETLNKKEV